MLKLVSSWSNVQSLPEDYVFPRDKRPGEVIAPLCKTIPVINLQDAIANNRNDMVQQIVNASQEYGFFQVINHGVSEALMDDTMKLFKDFFDMPDEDKASVYSEDPSDVYGLQVFKDGQWIGVEPITNAIVVNIGHQLQLKFQAGNLQVAKLGYRKFDLRRYMKMEDHDFGLCNEKYVPESYIFPQEERPGELLIPICHNIPVIDLGKAASTEHPNTIEQILKAGQQFGFFQVVNHGISEDITNDTVRVLKDFFGMPAEEKVSSTTANRSGWVYTSSTGYAKDGVHLWRENIKHPCHPLEECMQLWPENPSKYREAVAAYLLEMGRLSLRILKLICEGLGLEPGYFEESSEVQLLSANMYPPCPDPSLTLGLLRHCDPSLITILFQGNVSGLQVFKDGHWIGVGALSNAFLVNIGNQLEIISNGKLRSAEHRVVTNSSEARTTIATFINPSPDCIVEPATTLLNDDNPPHYKPFLYKDFVHYSKAFGPDTEAIQKGGGSNGKGGRRLQGQMRKRKGREGSGRRQEGGDGDGPGQGREGELGEGDKGVGNRDGEENAVAEGADDEVLGEGFLESYVFPQEDRPGKLLIPICQNFPVIDLGKAATIEHPNTIKQIVKAGQEFGCFQVVNHGISEDIINDTVRVFKDFLGMPAKEKASSTIANRNGWVYTASSDYARDGIHLWRDNIKHPCHPLEECMQLWPEKPSKFREAVAAYLVEIGRLSLRILKLICEALGLEPGYFEESSEVQVLSASIYPPCPDPSLTLGLVKHTDPSLITILFEGDVSGFQVFKDGHWIGVGTLSNAFLVNIGNQLEIISNGKLKSAEHRAVTNSSEARATIATFINPSFDCVIEPAKALVNDLNPQLYKPFQYKDFVSTSNAFGHHSPTFLHCRSKSPNKPSPPSIIDDLATIVAYDDLVSTAVDDDLASVVRGTIIDPLNPRFDGGKLVLDSLLTLSRYDGDCQEIMDVLISNWSNVQSLPKSYVFPSGRRPGNQIVPLCKDIPVVDLGKAEGVDRSETVQKILKASQQFGFFQVINHGVPESVADNAMNVFKEFFGMPAEYKATFYSNDPNKSCRLYTSTLNYDKEEVHYWRDNFTHHCHPLEDNIQDWPENPTTYRDIVGAYSGGVREFLLRILDLIAEGLGLATGYFNSELSKIQLLSVNHHIPCPDPSLTLGMPEHCDPNLISMIHQCDISGLQVFKDGEWIGVEPLPNAFVVIAGLQLRVLSNDMLTSPIHRVVTHPHESRTTICTFLIPSSDIVIEPAGHLIDARNPAFYRAYNYKEFFGTFTGTNCDAESALKCFRV
ncbi:hypothetical protein RJ639_040564 [Escallonia herrerae]|uniref:Fe2OG dioxygenase domain-containing protein n=1 Tax=Escallonia herrerae TaxID=1293975 RepID=A0AA89B6C9_9ASTE|nr:hypothetical protein RJ639_040564 [Escallonia herrerae]